MTEAERELWKQVGNDYKNALSLSMSVWGNAKEGITPLEVIQAGAATLLIQYTKLREGSHRAVAQPATPPAAVTRGKSEAPQAPVGVPPCPSCGGEMWDNRTNKKNPAGADFTCKQKNGECKNNKGFKTALWLKDLKPSPVMAAAISRTLAEVPVALDNGEDGDLPF